ncbi:hypothetical protein [Terrabacter terrae]
MGAPAGGEWPSSGPGATEAATVETVERLDEDGGLYLARSRSSLHVFDLDNRAYLRLPGERSNAFPHDVSVLRLTGVERWPHVGDTFFIWVDQPSEFAVWDYWRQSSAIAALYRVWSAGERRGRGDVGDTRGSSGTTPSSATSTGPGSMAGPAGPDGPDGPGSPAGPDGPDSPDVSRSGGEAGGAARRGPGPAEVLPGLEVVVDGVWHVFRSSAGPLEVRGSRLKPDPVLEWPLTCDEEWLTLLVVYQLEIGMEMRAHLEVRPSAGGSGLRSTSQLTSMRLIVPEQPPWPVRRLET